MAHSAQVNEQITWQTDTTTNNSSCNKKGQQQHATSTSSLKKLAKKQKALDCSSSNERNSANATLHLNVAKQKNKKTLAFYASYILSFSPLPCASHDLTDCTPTLCSAKNTEEKYWNDAAHLCTTTKWQANRLCCTIGWEYEPAGL